MTAAGWPFGSVVSMSLVAEAGEQGVGASTGAGVSGTWVSAASPVGTLDSASSNSERGTRPGTGDAGAAEAPVWLSSVPSMLGRCVGGASSSPAPLGAAVLGTDDADSSAAGTVVGASVGEAAMATRVRAAVGVSVLLAGAMLLGRSSSSGPLWAVEAGGASRSASAALGWRGDPPLGPGLPSRHSDAHWFSCCAVPDGECGQSVSRAASVSSAGAELGTGDARPSGLAASTPSSAGIKCGVNVASNGTDRAMRGSESTLPTRGWKRQRTAMREGTGYKQLRAAAEMAFRLSTRVHTLELAPLGLSGLFREYRPSVIHHHGGRRHALA